MGLLSRLCISAYPLFIGFAALKDDAATERGRALSVFVVLDCRQRMIVLDNIAWSRPFSR